VGSLNTIYYIGLPNDDIFPHVWTPIPNGIQLTAYGPSIQNCPRVTIVQVLCNANITAVPQNLTLPVTEAPTCNYHLTITHASGCGYPVVNTTAAPITTSAPVNCGSSTSDTTVTGAGFGVGLVVGVVISVIAAVALLSCKRCRGKAGSKWNKMDDDKSLQMPGTASREETTNM